MPTIVHFDISVDDIERAKKFYTDLFNWKIEKMPGPMEYYGITTATEKGEEGIGGGMALRKSPNDAITNFIGVSSIDEHIVKVGELGGKIIQPKMAVPGFGYLAACFDTENNVFGLWQDDKNAKI